MTQITIASYNTHKCVGVDGICNPHRIIEVIKSCKADVIALQEVDKRFGKREAILDPYEILQETGLQYAEIETAKPDSIGWHGNAIFYKDMQLLSIERINLPGLEPRGALFASFEKEGFEFCIIGAHFGLLRNCRKVQIKTILSILSKKYSIPAFLMGDLNEWRTDKKSAIRELENHFQIYSSFANASFPSRFPFLSLDKIYASHKEMIVYTKVIDTKLSRMASDHLPITALVNLIKF